jgi:hypothetical protein
MNELNTPTQFLIHFFGEEETARDIEWNKILVFINEHVLMEEKKNTFLLCKKNESKHGEWLHEKWTNGNVFGIERIYEMVIEVVTRSRILSHFFWHTEIIMRNDIFTYFFLHNTYTKERNRSKKVRWKWKIL